MEKTVFAIVFKNGMNLRVTKRGFVLWNGTGLSRQWCIDASCLIDDDGFTLGQHTTTCESKIGNQSYKAARQKIAEAGNSAPNSRVTRGAKRPHAKRTS